MKFCKASYKKRSTYTYKSVTGEEITIAPGDANGAITVELISFLHAQDDAEVYSNWKNCMPSFSNEEEDMIYEWEATYPEEEVPKDWIMSLDILSEKMDSDMDCSGLISDVYDRSQTGNYAAARLREVIDEMPYKQRQAFVLVELDGYSLAETADKLGYSIVKVSKLITRAKTFIQENY